MCALAFLPTVPPVLDSRPLQELPVLTKALEMVHFDELVTDRALHCEEMENSL